MRSYHQTRPSAPVETAADTVASIADWLCLAAAPTFAIVAIVTTASSRADMVCSAMQDAFPLDGMTIMYLLMCAFHLPPWLRLISGRVVGPEHP